MRWGWFHPGRTKEKECEHKGVRVHALRASSAKRPGKATVETFVCVQTRACLKEGQGKHEIDTSWSIAIR